MKKIIIGCDNAAIDFKCQIKEFVISLGYIVEDVGIICALDETYYPVIAQSLCEKIKENHYQAEGILMCGTGIGMALAANKIKGIRAAVCHDIFSTQRSKLSNHCNVMCMGARVIAPETAKVLVAEWLSLEFQDGSSTPKVEAICSIENATMK